MTTSASPVAGFVYGLQAASWRNDEMLEPGMTKIGSTQRTVDERVAEMQRGLGAGGVHRLVVAFVVPVPDLRIERAVHAALKADGRHLSTGSASEWFSIEPDEAEVMVRGFVSGERDLSAALAAHPSVLSSARNRSSIKVPKELKMTPTRAAALQAVREAASRGGSRSEFAGGRWGAAATALAVEEGISKAAALVLMEEWFVEGMRGNR